MESLVRHPREDERLIKSENGVSQYEVGDTGIVVWRDKNGLLHNDNEPAYVDPEYDVERWYQHGVMHRDDGPALNMGDYHEYRKNGKLHRLDGPALYHDGDPTDSKWFIDGEVAVTHLAKKFFNPIPKIVDVVKNWNGSRIE